jgi:hypothetical protein
MHWLSAESSEAVTICRAEPIGGTYVRSSCGCCDMRPRTHDDVPTGNVGRGLRAIPRDLELDEARSSDSGCSFEDAGPVGRLLSRAELSVVRGGASASPAGREFEIAY